MRKTPLLFILFIIVLICSSVNGESIVDSDTIKDWANSYLDEYMKIIEDNFGQEHGYYFNFYGTHPFEIKSAISSKNGVAIEMIPREDKSEMTFENNFTEKDIEIAVFYDNLLNLEILDAEAYNYMREIEKLDCAMIKIGTNNVIINITLITRNGSVNCNCISLYDYSDVLFIKMIVDGVYYRYTYFDGNNSISHWTEEHAKNKAQYHIKNDLDDVFINAFENDEFKNFFAQPELKSKIVNIKNKLDETRKNTSYNYTTYDLEIDLKEVDYIAFEKYGITNDFFRNIIHFLDADYIFPDEKKTSDNTTNLENEDYLQYILNAIISSILILLFLFIQSSKHNFFSDKSRKLLESIILILFSSFYIYFIFEAFSGINFIQILLPIVLAICILYLTRKEPEFYIKYKRRKRFNKYIDEIRIDGYTNISDNDAHYFIRNYDSKEIQKIKNKKILEEFMGRKFNGD